MQARPSQCIKEYTMNNADRAAIIAGGTTALAGAALAYGTYRMSKQAHNVVKNRNKPKTQEEDSWHA
jgi:hypothetical protein